MMRTFKPHLEILPPEQRALWAQLRPVSALNFVLYGGTAIALRLGHRQSVDFDFFSDKALDRQAVQEALPFMRQSTTLQDQANTWVVLTPSSGTQGGHVKLSFFGTINFGRIGEPDSTEDGVLQAASLIDLMATKLKVILQRAEANLCGPRAAAE